MKLLCVFIMANKIQLFYTVQNLYKISGIYSTQPNQLPSFNYKFFYILLSMAFMIIATLTFFIFEANSAMDYGMSFSGTLMELTSAIFYIVNMIRMPNIIKFIENCEKFIEKSESYFELHFKWFFNHFYLSV